MRIRKQAYELTSQDFEQFPIWEFALDEEGLEGQDEATVRPYSVAGSLDAAEGTFLVKAQFLLADGTRMGGCLTPSLDGNADIGAIQPVIMTPGGHVDFWNGIFRPKPEELKRKYELLGRTAERAFPIKFSSAIEIVNGPVTGSLNAFLYMDPENDKTIEVR
jgi:hypothetical protein